MKERLYTVEQIANEINEKRIVCYGAGKFFRHSFLKDVQYFPDIISKIEFVIDNNAENMGGYVDINGKKVRVLSFEDALFSMDNNKLVLITVEKKEEEVKRLLENRCKNIDAEFVIWRLCRDYYVEDKEVKNILERNGTREKIIPRKIHYCWFGKKKMPDSIQVCIESWMKYCPEYEIKLWNDDNFDICMNDYAREAYERRKFAFVSDYARLYILYNEGGVYLDSDVELVGNLDEFLCHDMFSGFEDRFMIPTGIMGAKRGSIWCGFFLSYYNNRHFYIDGQNDETTNVQIITEMYKEKTRKTLMNSYFEDEGFAIYPQEVFCPLDYKTGRISKTANTRAIHWFADSWERPI